MVPEYIQDIITQVIELNIFDRIENTMVGMVYFVGERIQNAIAASLTNVIVPEVEMASLSMENASRQGLYSVRNTII